MEIVFYVIIFIIGACLGSFYVETIYRIDKEQKVFSTYRYCPNCEQKLSFIEKIPIISYVLFRGKCKKCKKKIDNEHICLEIITGNLLLITAYAINFTFSSFNISKLISFIFIILYFSYVILTSGLDKKGRSMSPSLLAFGVIISLVYIVYLCVVETKTVYSNIIYLILMTILLLINIITTRKRAQSNYTIDLLTTLLIMLIFTQEIVSLITVISTLIAMCLCIFINKIRRIKLNGNKTKTEISKDIRIVYIMGFLNIFIFLTLIIISQI